MWAFLRVVIFEWILARLGLRWLLSLAILVPLALVFFVGIPAMILIYFSWLPVLVLGRQARPVIDLLGGYWRWSTRVSAYVLLLTDRYPPFRLGS